MDVLVRRSRNHRIVCHLSDCQTYVSTGSRPAIVSNHPGAPDGER